VLNHFGASRFGRGIARQKASVLAKTKASHDEAACPVTAPINPLFSVNQASWVVSGSIHRAAGAASGSERRLQPEWLPHEAHETTVPPKRLIARDLGKSIGDKDHWRYSQSPPPTHQTRQVKITNFMNSRNS
jgi:hypothetical protein